MPDSSLKVIGIPISLRQLERDPGFPTSPREASRLTCKGSRRIPRCPSQLDRSHDIAEQTRVLKGHPYCNSRIYPGFPLQIEKKHETFPSQRDEALFHCIACRAIPCSPSNMKGALTSLMELQRVPRNTVTSLPGH